jgi:sporulation protein YlmC with PRC-barrel domain
MKSQEITTSDDILGKEAVDPDGTILGVVTKLHIGKQDKKVTGITIDMGFMKPDLFIGVDYIRQFGVDAILLKKVPPDKFKGLQVVTFDGKNVGRIKEVIIAKTNIKEFVVSSPNIFGKAIRVQFRDIKEIGEQVILKQGFSP